MKSLLIALGFLSTVPAFAQHIHETHGQRQTDVAKRGADVMPFDVAATTHVFTKTNTGGVLRVVAKRKGNVAQTKLVRVHLRDVQQAFRKGDFSSPSHIHGDDMPCLAELKAAKPGQLAIIYREVTDGAELTYKTKDPHLVEALHRWFDAQLSDHGADAMEGHQHHHQH